MARTGKNRKQFNFEILEDRSVPASGLSASLANGQLSILGTDADDMITVRHVPAQSRVPAQIRIDGLSQTFDPARVTRIVVQGGQGNDTIDFIANRATMGKPGYTVELWGGAGNDHLAGSLNADKLFGGPGNDVLFGGAGNDLLDGGEGDDVLYGEAGADTLFGDSGNDQMFGGAGGDNLIGGSGDDYYQGNYGLDYYIEASPGNETFDDNPNDVYNRVYFRAGASHPLAAFDQLSDSGIRTALRAQVLDGQFGRQDMLELFYQVKADGIVSETEFNDLQAITTMASLKMSEVQKQLFASVVTPGEANLQFQGQALEALQAGSSSDVLDKLVRKWFLGQDRPELTNSTYTYQYAQGSLFGTKNLVNAQDVRAGFPNLVNTNIFAGMATVAQNDPNVIRNLFINNGDGTFTVKLMVDNQARYVTVDRYLPVDTQGKLVYGRLGAAANSTTNVLWPALLEKAFAQAAESGWMPQRTVRTINSYSSIDGRTGTSPFAGQIISLLTGRDVSLGNQLTSQSMGEMLEAYQSKEMVVVCSNMPPNCGALPSAKVASGRYYTILSYNPAKGGSFKLQLATGTGTFNDGNGRITPGIITLTTAEFLANMQFYDTTQSNSW